MTTETDILARLDALETYVTQLQTAVSNLASKADMRAQLAIRQTTIDELEAAITALTTRVSLLENSITAIVNG